MGDIHDRIGIHVFNYGIKQKYIRPSINENEKLLISVHEMSDNNT